MPKLIPINEKLALKIRNNYQKLKTMNFIPKFFKLLKHYLWDKREYKRQKGLELTVIQKNKITEIEKIKLDKEIEALQMKIDRRTEKEYRSIPELNDYTGKSQKEDKSNGRKM